MTIRQTRPGELVDILRTDFQDRNEPNFAWKSAVSSCLAIPGVVGIWPMSVIRLDNVADRVRDVSGGAYHLTWNGGLSASYDNLAPRVAFNGTTGYLSRVAGAASWASILGNETHIPATVQGMTCGGWFYFNDVTVNQAPMSKFDVANQQSYMLFLRGATSQIEFHASSAGTTATRIIAGGPVLSVDTWYFITGTFDNTANVITIRANDSTTDIAYNLLIFDSTADFFIGAVDNGPPAYFLDGMASLCWLSQLAVSDAIQFSLYHQQRSLLGI